MLFALVLAVALALRLHRLGEESLWVDEAITYGRALKSPQALIRDTIGRKHIPTYFLFMHHWLALGDSEFMLRLPSALFGSAACGLGYAIGALAGGPIAGLATGLLLASAPVHLHYGQEARMYALLTFTTGLALLGLALLARADLERGRWLTRLSPRVGPERRVLCAWALLWLGTTATLYVHNTAVFFVAALQIAGLCLGMATPGRRMVFAANWVATMGLGLLAWSPWIPHLIEQSGTFDRWKQKPFSLALAGQHLNELLAMKGGTEPLGWLLAGMLALGLWGKRGRRRPMLVLACCAVSGLGLAALVSHYKANMFFVRTLLWTTLPAYAVVGVGLARLPKGSGLLVLAVMLNLVAPRASRYYETTTKPRWRDLLQELADKTTGDDVILGVRITRFTAYYYHRKQDPIPSRAMRHVARQKRLEDIVGSADHFWVLAKRSAGRMKHFRYLERKSPRYQRVTYRRSRDALLMEYRRKPRERPRARKPPDGAAATPAPPGTPAPKPAAQPVKSP